MEKDPNIFEYDNYRDYLKDYYKSKKISGQSFSFRIFAKKAGFSSSNYLKLVMDGKRNLSYKGIEKCLRALSLKNKEAEFYKNLVRLNQAKTDMEKKRFAKEVNRARIQENLTCLGKDKQEYWSNWYHVVIREIFGLEQIPEDLSFIGSKIIPPISSKEVENTIKILQKLGLLRKNKDGQLEQCQGNITSGDKENSKNLIQFHREMIDKGKEAIDCFPSDKRMVSSLTFSLAEENVKSLKNIVNKFFHEVMELSNQKQNAKTIYQINLQFFPLTRKIS